MSLMRFGLYAAGICCSLIVSANAQEQRLLIGSTSSASSHYGYYVSVSQIINNQVEGVQVNVAETGATLDNLRRMARGQVDLGLVTTNVAYEAWNGTGAFEGKPYRPMTLWVYSFSPQNVVVRKDAGISKLSDLNGKIINPGITGSATESTALSVFKALGVTPDWMRGSTGDIVDAIKDNRAIGYVKGGVGHKLDASTLDIATLTPLMIIGLSDAEAKTIAEKFPNLAVMEIPENAAADGYPQYKTWAFGTATLARAEMDEDTAYKIVKAVVEDNTLQAAAFGGLLGSELVKMTMELASTPLHPGAVRYYREIGAEIPEHLLPE